MSNSLLSIQSHVVHGYVGNKAATFPLQCLGWDVDVMNSVNFSNHTGYGSVKGVKTSAKDLRLMYEGLEDIGMMYNALLTGYVPDAESLKVVGEIGRDVKSKNPDAIWLLDPVLGDEGQLYVSEDVIPVYKDILLGGGVDIITPNQFEVEILVGFEISSDELLKEAISKLHHVYKVDKVVVSSLMYKQDGKIMTVCSVLNRSTNEISSSYFQVPYIESYFTGVGDLFSALLVDRVCKAHLSQSKEQLENLLNQVLSIMKKVLYTTTEAVEKALGKAPKSKMGSAVTMKECELRLVQCRDYYSSKCEEFKCFKL